MFTVPCMAYSLHSAVRSTVTVFITILFLTSERVDSKLSLSSTYHFNSRPVDVAVASNGQVYAVGGKTLYSLQPSLMLEQSFLLTAKDTVANKVALSSDESTLIICFRDGSCYTYPIDSLSDLDFVCEDGVIATIAGESVALTSGSTIPNQFYVGSSGYVQPGGNHIILLRTYEFVWEGESLLRSSENFVVTNSTFVSRDFYDAFASGPYVYFVAVDASTNLSSSGVKIMRVCNDANDTSFSAMIEVELQCSALGDRDSTIISVSVMEDFGGAAGRSVTVGFRGESTDRFCSFDLSEIDSVMERVFQECVAGTHKISLPWVDYSLIAACSWFNEPEVTECVFGSSNSAVSTFIQALAAPTPVLGTTILELDSQDNVTSALALVVDGVSLLYVALTNQTGHSVSKFHLHKGRVPHLFEMYTFVSPVFLLKHGVDQVFAIMDTHITTFPLESCSSHSDCGSCTMSSDPLCGWCVLEQRCFRRTSCEHASLDNRWVTQYPQCITDIGITEEYLEANSQLSVGVYVSPTSARLPTLNSNEHYSCSFTNRQLNYSFQFLCSEDDMYSGCIGRQPSFKHPKLEVKFSFLSPNNQVLLQREQAITIYNCSRLNSCKECERIPACGWCVYDFICTSSQDLCPTHNSWIRRRKHTSQSRSTSECPVVLPPIKGRYVYPVAVEGNFTLHTRHLPPPDNDLRYACRLQYSKYRSIFVNATHNTVPTNNSKVTCHVAKQQVLLSSISKAVGIERLSLSLVWLDRARDVQYEFEYVDNKESDDIQGDVVKRSTDDVVSSPLPHYDMVIYNCSQLANSCSSCLAVNIGTDFDCGWCPFGQSRRCAIGSSNCFPHFVRASTFCPFPRISSIRPTSGHIEGGTRVTITGTDLGVRVNDVMEVMFGNSPCIIQPLLYVPGTTIVCSTTQSNVQTQVNVSVQIIRTAPNHNILRRTTYPSFTYALPTISSVFPLYGPVSGGTRVTIRGSELDISDTALTTASIAGVGCRIMSVSSSEIVCITSPSIIQDGLVLVHIDGHNISGERYSYAMDPVYHSVHPQNTIPAGGISLTFSGIHLNNSQRPMLRITLGSSEYTSVCRSVSSYTLQCIAPELPSTGSDNQRLNYTIIMDDAPGPSSDNTHLELRVRPNPVFVGIQESDQEYMGSEDRITILGRHLDVIQESEIEVKMEGVKCNSTVLSQQATKVVLKCHLPNITQHLTTTVINVKISIAGGTLEYDVGSLTYIPPYNCTKLANSCSSCLALNFSTSFGFRCNWCESEGDQQAVCMDSNECSTDTDLVSNLTDKCPPPVISSISPTSGHIEGGTRVTITGTDLGVRVDDVMEVTFGNSPCIIQQLLYVPGTQIECTTTKSNIESGVPVTVEIGRHHNRRATYPSFTYALPTISSVSPLYGPVSGGTRVTIRGSELDISDTALTTASIAGVECRIMTISQSEITCSTSGSRVVQRGRVTVTIDGHIIYGERYSYSSDPVYLSIYPRNTIPAGGVSLTFTGRYMNVTQEPRLVISIGDSAYSGICTALNSSTLTCLAPALLSLGGNTTRESMGIQGSIIKEGYLNYSVIADNVPGPSRESRRLELLVRPNPLFVQTTTHALQSQDCITLFGMYLDAVQQSEYEISVNDVPCNIVSLSRTMLKCNLPEPFLTNKRIVKVSIANGTLEYDIQQEAALRGSQYAQWSPIVYTSIGIVFLFTVIAVCALFALCFMKYRHRQASKQQETNPH